ncbi:MAG: nucleotidyltransferase family protein [Cecembia sp.]
MDKFPIGIIILAAGGSIRLGQPKQLLTYRGKTLLENAIDAGKQSKAMETVVVLGGNEAVIRRHVNFGQTLVISNPDWEKGMSVSLRLGLNFLISRRPLEGILLMLVDQPFVDAALLDKMMDNWVKNRKGIVACAYQNTLGVPTIFGKEYFPELLALSATEGAKKVIYSHPLDTLTVDFPLGSVDVDTQQDYENLLGSQ